MGRKTTTVFAALMAVLGACGPDEPLAKEVAKRVTYADPKPYCSAVGNRDGEPDERYTGPETPDWMLALFKRTKESDGYVAWRCKAGKVLVCENGGITGPCDKKETTRMPSDAMREFCREQPNSASIPAYATGHYTVYYWRCSGRVAAIDGQHMFPDNDGYMPDEWQRVAD